MGYRKISVSGAKYMAKAAGLTRNQILRCDFREGMAEHAAKLIISRMVKGRRNRDSARNTALEVAGAATAAQDA